MPRGKRAPFTPTPMSFETLCVTFRCSEDERRELWEFLAFMRFRHMLAHPPSFT